MKKYIIIILLTLFPAVLYGNENQQVPESANSLKSACKIIDDDTIELTINGQKRKISLYGISPTGKDSEQAQKLIALLLSDEEVSITTYGDDGDSAIVVAGGININEEMLRHAFSFVDKSCNDLFCRDWRNSYSNNYVSSEKLKIIGSRDSSSYNNYSLSSDYSSNYRKTDLSERNISVRGYYRKDGTYVRPHRRSSPGTRSRRK